MALSMRQAGQQVSSKCKGYLQYCSSRTLSSQTKEKKSYERRIFSGIQPTGIPHIGNYLGAISQWTQLQKRHGSVIISIVDLHSITVPQDPETLRYNIRDMAISLLAAGIDPQKSIIFQQSCVSEHAELGWILGCLTTMPRLQHLPQWKQKSSSMKEVPLGLFTYPVLQSADILLYKATDVPVGDDQVKHIELTRHLAKLFNNKYKEVFPRPRIITGEFDRLKSLRNPEQKMSKSDPNKLSRIDISDSPEEINEKIKKAVTDSNPLISYDCENRPGISNLITLHSAVTDLDPEEIVENSMLLDTVGYKETVAAAVIEKLSPIREEILRLRNESGYVDQILNEGNKRAKDIAQETFGEVRHALGMTIT